MPRKEYEKGQEIGMDICGGLMERSAAQYVINTLFDTEARTTTGNAGCCSRWER